MLSSLSPTVVAGIVLLAASAVLLFRSGVILSELRMARRVFLYLALLRSLVPIGLLLQMLLARARGRSTRLLRKRYRSVRRREWRRFISRYFEPTAAAPAGAEQVALALVCAFAGCAVLLLSLTPPEAVVARM